MTKLVQVPPSIEDNAVFRTLTTISRILNLKANYSQIVPTSFDSVGEEGMIAGDDNYIYRCIAKDTWKRTAISTW